MKLILTSSLGGAVKVDGRRLPGRILSENGLLSTLQSCWREPARVMMICSTPDDSAKNDGIVECFTQSFPRNGLPISRLLMCDGRNPEVVELIGQTDVVILTGGHVPTQNAFFHRIGLRERLQSFGGLVIGWSAGSMNCAETVYAGPEFPGEAIDPNYHRWLPGLGLTKTNILPHFQDLRDDILDGMRLIEDITFGDSMGHAFLAMHDGSYIVRDESGEVLYGEAYWIRDGAIIKACENGSSVRLFAAQS